MPLSPERGLTSVKGALLLGQSLLGRFKSWLGRVLINRGTPFDVRYAPDSGAKADIAGLPRWAKPRHERVYSNLEKLALS
jgi:hypothetical protein